jgi:glycerophosphoryl diester phosphodiesterase
VSAFRRAPGERPFVFGHRGARGRVPENTFAGFDLAIDEGADGIELDVRLCGSGQVVVCHDRTLQRVTAGRDVREVERVALADLQRIDVGGDERVPTLEAVLDWSARRRTRINVEVKRDVRDLGLLLERVAALLQTLPDAPARIILSSFDVRAVHWLARRVPAIAVGWLVYHRQSVLRHALGWRLLGAKAVHPEHVLCTESSVARWKRGGALVNTWTVNDPVEAVRLAKLGVDVIISDHAGKILKALA